MVHECNTEKHFFSIMQHIQRNIVLKYVDDQRQYQDAYI